MVWVLPDSLVGFTLKPGLKFGSSTDALGSNSKDRGLRSSLRARDLEDLPTSRVG